MLKKHKSGLYLPPHTGLWTFNEGSGTTAYDQRGFGNLSISNGTYVTDGLTIDQSAGSNRNFTSANEYMGNPHKFSLYAKFKFNAAPDSFVDILTCSTAAAGDATDYQWFLDTDTDAGGIMAFSVTGGSGDYGNILSVPTTGNLNGTTYHMLLSYDDRGTPTSYASLIFWIEGSSRYTTYQGEANNIYGLTDRTSQKLCASSITGAANINVTYYKMAWWNNVLMNKTDQLFAIVDRYWNA